MRCCDRFGAESIKYSEHKAVMVFFGSDNFSQLRVVAKGAIAFIHELKVEQ